MPTAAPFGGDFSAALRQTKTEPKSKLSSNTNRLRFGRLASPLYVQYAEPVYRLRGVKGTWRKSGRQELPKFGGPGRTCLVHSPRSFLRQGERQATAPLLESMLVYGQIAVPDGPNGRTTMPEARRALR
jgi:hypothetical protein